MKSGRDEIKMTREERKKRMGERKRMRERNWHGRKGSNTKGFQKNKQGNTTRGVHGKGCQSTRKKREEIVDGPSARDERRGESGRGGKETKSAVKGGAIERRDREEQIKKEKKGKREEVNRRR